MSRQGEDRRTCRPAGGSPTTTTTTCPGVSHPGVWGVGAEGAPEWGGTLGDRGRSPRKKATVAESRGRSEKPRGGGMTQVLMSFLRCCQKPPRPGAGNHAQSPSPTPRGLGVKGQASAACHSFWRFPGESVSSPFPVPPAPGSPRHPQAPLSAPLSYSHPPAPAREDPAVQGAHLQSPGWPPSHREGLGSEPRTQSPGDTR